jgi:long-subunit fatty acid transport protein
MRHSVSSYRLATISLILLTIICMVPQIASAQVPRIEIPSSYNPVGSGARALGMGGAFIAVADDATAASWNPGGLIQLETPEISIVGAYVDRTESNSFGVDPDADDSQVVTNSNINYLSAAYPFSAFGRNMIVSASHQYLYDFTRELEYPTTYSTSTFDYIGSGEMEHEGGLSAIGIAYSTQVTPTFSLGFTLNFWQDGLYDNELDSEVHESGSGIANGSDFTFNADTYDTFSYSGFNMNIGVLWNVSNQLTFGFVFKTPFTADIEHSHSENYDLRFPDNPILDITDSLEDDTDEELDLPMSYGIGVAYRFSDNLTASFDIYRTEWGDFTLTDENGDETSPITGEPIDDADIDPTHQVRTGVEYLHITDTYVIPVRGGLFYDPAPADGGSDAFYGYSFGTGFAKGKIVFDVAYQYRFGKDVAEFILEDYDFSQDMREHTIYASIIYHF